MSDITDLIARLGEASEGNRLLDFDIARLDWPAAHAKGMEFHWAEWKDDFHSVPPYTSVLDAALTLVPAGWHYSIDGYSGPGTTETYVYEELPGKDDEPTGRYAEVEAPTPALAICIAVLKARESQ